MPVIKNPPGGANMLAFLDMVAVSELGQPLLAVTDNGYNVIVGSTAQKPILFDSYATHPNRRIGPPLIGVTSTAAGRYQELHENYVAYTKLLKLADFSPLSQDLIAIQQIKERRALPLLANGNIVGAIAACSNIWASLPGNNYKQHQNKVDYLVAAFKRAGGAVSA